MLYKNIFTGETMQILSARKMSRYEAMKEAIREAAKEYQQNIYNISQSYAEIIEKQYILEKYGKRYGLIREFKENGII